MPQKNREEILKNLEDQIQEQEALHIMEENLANGHQEKANVHQENANLLRMTYAQIKGTLPRAEFVDTNIYKQRDDRSKTKKNKNIKNANPGLKELIVKMLGDFGNPCGNSNLYELTSKNATYELSHKNFNHMLSRIVNNFNPQQISALTSEGIVTNNPDYKPRFYALTEWLQNDKLKQGFIIDKNNL